MSKVAAIRQERRRIDELNPAEYNPRKRLKPGDAEYESLKRSIEVFGYVDPIIINADGTVIGGHQRLNVLIDLGYSEADVAVVDLNKNDEKALNIALNKIAGEWDEEKLAAIFAELDIDNYDLSLTGFCEDEYTDIVSSLAKAAQEQEPESEMHDPDAEVAPPKAQTTKPGDIWRIGRHRLMCGDSTDAKSVGVLMDGAKADMVFTDPPYALFGNSTGVSGVGDDKMIMPFFREIGRMIKHYLKPMGHAYVCHDWQTGSTIKEAFGTLTPKNLIVWRKSEAGGLGAFYTKIYELIWLFANEPEKGILGKTNVPARTINGVANIWDCPIVQAKDRVHNAQKPINVIKIAVENSSDKDEGVLDLFGGSGSTMIACERMGRTCYTMELEPKYCDIIVRRYMQVTGKTDVVLLRDGEEIPVADTGILND